MALTATYSTPESEWTRAMDAALAEWSHHIHGDLPLNVFLRFEDSPYLASNAALGTPAGTLADGTEVRLTAIAAAFQGKLPLTGYHASININDAFPWSFGASPEAGKYSAQDVLTHELGHALFASHQGGASAFDLWKASKPDSYFADDIHFSSANTLMYPTTEKGQEQHISPLDLEAMRASGIPTHGDDTFYLINGAVLDGGGGEDTAMWLRPFDRYNANLTNIENLELRGANPLNEFQQNAYKLYRAGMGRDPDLAGFQWWNTNKPQTFEEMAAAFSHSPEFVGKFGAPGTRDRGQYIGDLYTNILGRPAEQAGLDYWMNSGFDEVGLLANIALAPENEIGIPLLTL